MTKLKIEAIICFQDFTENDYVFTIGRKMIEKTKDWNYYTLTETKLELKEYVRNKIRNFWCPNTEKNRSINSLQEK